MAKTYSDTVKVFKALSDENRLMLVLSLADGEMSATELLKSVPFSQPTLSHHLSLLCDGGVLISRRDGKSVFYRINTEAAETIGDVASTLAGAKSEPAKKSAPVRAKRASAPRKPKPEPEESPAKPPQEEEAPVRRAQVFDFFD